MKLNRLIVLLLLTVSCGQDYNSNTGDGALGTGTSKAECATPSQARFCRARQVLADHCYSCHAGWSDFSSDKDWGASGLITAGDSQQSRLIRYLKNVGGNMPLGSSAIADVDYQALVDWINNFSVN